MAAMTATIGPSANSPHATRWPTDVAIILTALDGTLSSLIGQAILIAINTFGTNLLHKKVSFRRK